MCGDTGLCEGDGGGGGIYKQRSYSLRIFGLLVFAESWERRATSTIVDFTEGGESDSY